MNIMHKVSLLIQRTKCVWLLLSYFLFPCADVNAQLTDSLKNAFLRYTEDRFQEKIYVKTDREQYLAGDIIWLKLYNVNAYYHKPVTLGKVAYVELVDLNNQVIMAAKIKVDSGRGAGSFYIPSQVMSGNYKLRAYTNWMKNFSADLYFEKQLSIINTIKDFTSIPVNAAPGYDIQFFPEGGQLVSGIQSKVAFRVINEEGKGQQFIGALVNNNSDTVARFQPSAFGIGSFQFLPDAKQTYKSVIFFPDGNIKTIALTAPLERGYVLSVTNEEADQIEVNVETNIDTARQVFLLAHTRQVLQFVNTIPLVNGKALFRVSKNLIGEGITHFTLFDESQSPICERLVFVPPQNLEIKIDIDAETYVTRQPLQIGVSTVSAGLNGKADISLSVYKIDSLNKIPCTDINSYLWLSSELKGSIESPAYYFSLPSKDAMVAFDNLMLTHGWRRFNWQQLKKAYTDPIAFPPEYQGQLITALVKDQRTGKLAAGIEGFLSVQEAHNNFSNSLSDNNGRLWFEVKDLYGPAMLVLQATQNADSSLQVEIESPYSQKFSSTPITPFSLPSIPATLLQNHMAVQVTNVYHGARLNLHRRPVIDTTAFYGIAKSSYLLEDYTRFKTVEEILREYVKLVFVKKRGGKAYIQVYDEEAKTFLEDDALVLVDGVPVFDINKMMALDPMQLGRLEVMNRKYIYGSSIFDGILSWKSVDGKLAGYQLEKQVLSIDYEGLQYERIFYSPKYDTKEKADSPLPDFRTLLYWSPDMRINGNGSTPINFYTSDLPGKYVIVAEGLSEDGHTGSVMRFIEVKKKG